MWPLTTSTPGSSGSRARASAVVLEGLHGALEGDRGRLTPRASRAVALDPRQQLAVVGFVLPLQGPAHQALGVVEVAHEEAGDGGFVIEDGR